jgi:hypothetical protein
MWLITAIFRPDPLVISRSADSPALNVAPAEERDHWPQLEEQDQQEESELRVGRPGFRVVVAGRFSIPATIRQTPVAIQSAAASPHVVSGSEGPAQRRIARRLAQRPFPGRSPHRARGRGR